MNKLLKSFLITATLVTFAAANASAGLVLLSGDDADDSGHCNGTLCGGLYAAVLSSAVSTSASPGSGILAIGVNDSQALIGLNSWNAPVNGGPGATITFRNSIADIDSVNFADYDVIYIPSNSLNTAGGITPAQLTALNTRQADIVHFLNVLGGSLVALTEAGSSNQYGWLPVALTIADEQHADVTPTADMAAIAPGATATNMDHGFYHTVFLGPPGFSGLKVLAISADAPANHAVIIGGVGVTITANVTCQITPSGPFTVDAGSPLTFDIKAFDPSPLQTVTLNSLGSLPSGASMTPALPISGPNTGIQSTFNWTPTVLNGGTHLVQFIATDSPASLAETCSVSITVNVPDTIPPVFFGCHDTLVVLASDSGTVVNYVVEATDNVDTSVTHVCVPPSGSLFPPGTTTVICTATDKAGNTATCTFHVIVNRKPDCSGAVASQAVLWPPNHSYHAISVLGVTDPDSDAVTITVTRVTQDEPTNTRGDGNTCPDAQISGSQVSVRAERTGTPGIPGNGRVYAIYFTADDGRGGRCSGIAYVCVPHDMGHPTCIDDGQRYESTGPCTSGNVLGPEAVSLQVEGATQGDAHISFALPTDTFVDVSVFDVSGRRLATIDRGMLAMGVYDRSWNVNGLANGVYFVRLKAGGVTLTKTVLRVR